jgi:hypothetical protein
VFWLCILIENQNWVGEGFRFKPGISITICKLRKRFPRVNGRSVKTEFRVLVPVAREIVKFNVELSPVQELRDRSEAPRQPGFI